MAVLTDKEQTLVGTVSGRGMSTHRAGLRGVMRVYIDRHTALQQGFIRDHTLQFGKRPFGRGSIRLPLFPARLPTMLALGALANVGQVLQTNDCRRVLGHDAFGDTMIGVGFQPSLSPADRHEATSSSASAFLLQTLSQSRIMIGFGDNVFPRIDRRVEDVCTA